jgi:hypothetical protein
MTLRRCKSPAWVRCCWSAADGGVDPKSAAVSAGLLGVARARQKQLYRYGLFLWISHYEIEIKEDSLELSTEITHIGKVVLDTQRLSSETRRPARVTRSGGA